MQHRKQTNYRVGDKAAIMDQMPMTKIQTAQVKSLIIHDTGNKQVLQINTRWCTWYIRRTCRENAW